MTRKRAYGKYGESKNRLGYEKYYTGQYSAVEKTTPLVSTKRIFYSNNLVCR